VAEAAHPRRPLPQLAEPDTAPFWRATREGRLTYQVCRRCGAVVFHPRAHCTRCGGLELEWRTSAGRGSVYTFTVIRQHGHPFFAGRVPYVLALVDLDEGFRMLTELVEVDPERVRVGRRVELTWEDAGEVRIPVFRPQAED
jgi:uncharacterized OB-fold protein